MSVTITSVLTFSAEPEVHSSALLVFLGDPLDNVTAWEAEGDCVILLEDFGELLAGDEIPGSYRDGAFIGVPGDYSTARVAVGIRRDTDITLSKLYIREQAQDGGVASETDAETNIRDLYVKYDKTGGLKVTVLPDGRSAAYVSQFTGDTNDEDGTLKAPVQNNNEQVEIHIKNNTCHRPFSVVGLAWDAISTQKTRR